jgi:hypothetical protein
MFKSLKRLFGKPEPMTEAERIAASLGFQYYDLRSEGYKKLERQAERELGPEDEVYARQLVSISQASDQAAARSVGERLNADGGLERMKRVCLRAGTLGADTRWIEVYWSGIGQWLG